MADNSVTIALKLDTSQFSNSLAQVQKDIGGLGIGRGMPSGGGSRGAGSRMTLEKEVGKMNTSLSKLTSTMMGNLSAGNISGIVTMAISAVFSPEFLLALPLIAAGVSALVIIMEALTFAFKPIQTILSAIGKVLGATLMPISMVIVQMLAPLISVMMPFIRLMNLIFLPIRKIIANYMKANAANLQQGGLAAFNVFWTGLLIGVGSMMTIFGAELLKSLLSALEWVALTISRMIGKLLFFDDIKLESEASRIRTTFQNIRDAVSSVTNQLVADSEKFGPAMESIGDSASIWRQNMQRQAINTPSDWQNLMTSGVTAVAEGRRTVPGLSAEEARQILSEWSGGASANLTFNVSGNMDEKTAKYVTEVVQRQLATAMRSVER